MTLHKSTSGYLCCKERMEHLAGSFHCFQRFNFNMLEPKFVRRTIAHVHPLHPHERRDERKPSKLALLRRTASAASNVQTIIFCQCSERVPRHCFFSCELLHGLSINRYEWSHRFWQCWDIEGHCLSLLPCQWATRPPGHVHKAAAWARQDMSRQRNDGNRVT